MNKNNYTWYKPVLVISIIFISFCLLLVGNTLRLNHRLSSTLPQTTAKISVLQPPKAVSHLSQAIQIKTISAPKEYNVKSFDNFIEFMSTKYPLVRKNLKRKIMANKSVLYQWKGRDPSKGALVLMAHIDVVPVETSQLSRWTYPPFSGRVVDGKIWGRGALDDKGNLIAILEASEYLLEQGYQPEQTIYLAFGADEEIDGLQGNAKIAQWLKKEGVKIDAVLDEGIPITQGIMPGVSVPVASIAVTEKGYASFKLTAVGPGGHSSLATINNPITQLGQVLQAIEKDSRKTQWTPILNEFFQDLIPTMEWPFKLVFSNLWLSKPVVLWIMAQKPTTAALVQSAMALTQFHAGIKDNVIPKRAEAVINFRVLPGSSTVQIEHMIKSHLVGTPITVERLGLERREPIPASDRNAPSYRVLKKTIRETFPNVVVAPNLMVGATDSRHYKILTNNIYRFSPWIATAQTLNSLHGLNEYIGIHDFYGAITFYYNLIKNSGNKKSPPQTP